MPPDFAVGYAADNNPHKGKVVHRGDGRKEAGLKQWSRSDIDNAIKEAEAAGLSVRSVNKAPATYVSASTVAAGR